MKKTGKKLMSITMIFTMIASTFQSGIVANATEVAKYTIYPTPHSIEYGEKEITLSDQINVVYDGEVDQYTKNHVNDVFRIVNKTTKDSQNMVDNQTNVLIGIYAKEKKGVVNQYFEDHNIGKEFDFQKNDASILSIKNNNIAILAKDSDAAFHAVTSLKHILKQVKDSKLTELIIQDYADVKGRGFIEGYYGNPWSNEDRADLMRFGGDYKLNQYIYAPKDDPKHNAKWRELYTTEELNAIKQLAEAGNQSKCYYVYALHTFMHNPIRFDSNYDADLKIIKDKFEQLMDAGVKQFAILADDAGVPNNNPQHYVKLMKDMTDWMKEKAKTVSGLKTDLIFCPNDYMGWGTSAQMQALKQLPESVSIIQTGGKVWGEVGPNFNHKFYDSMKRPAYMWINWPCSDNTKDSLIMGGADYVLKPNVKPETVSGIVLNPMQQSEPSKAGLFTNADYAWNIWKDTKHYETVWHDSFNYIDHGTKEDTKGSIAYRELSKHMLNSDKLYNDESFEIKDQLKQFLLDFKSGKSVKNQAIALQAEFRTLQQAAKDYRAYTGNKRTLNQIIYWIDCWDDTTDAILNFLDCVIALESQGSSSAIVDAYLKGQASVEQSKTHTFKYVNGFERAVAGRVHVTPFMNQLDQLLSQKVELIVNPNKQLVHYISNREDNPEGNTDYVFDNNPATQIIYKNPTTIKKGTYVGITYRQPIDIDEVIFRMGQSGNDQDTFTKAKLEYTKDGSNWISVNDKVYSPVTTVHESQLKLKGIKGIRLIATEEVQNKWLGIKDIVVNPDHSTDEEVIQTTITVSKIGVKVGALTDITDKNMNSYAHFAEDPYKAPNASYEDYIPKDATVTLTYDKPKTITGIHFKQDSGTDKLTKYALEYSEDGKEWKTLKSYNGDPEITYQSEKELTVKAIQVRNLEVNKKDEKSGYWWKLYDFQATENTKKPTTKKYVYTNTDASLTSRYELAHCELIAKNTIELEKNEYVGLDLKRIKDLSSIDIDVKKDDSIQLQVSKNALDWIDLNHQKNIVKEDARYIRYINKGNKANITIKKFIVNSHEISAPFLHKTTMGINQSWGVKEDTRNNGAAFDGDVNTTTEFADFPQKDQYIIYDLGQNRNIHKLELFSQDSAVNYIRDADVQVSSDLTNWTTVFKIGDGVENQNDADITCVNSDAGYQASNQYPNKVSISGTIEPKDVRYLRIYFTATNQNRAVLFNEILINDGEYVPVTNDPTFQLTEIEKQGHAPQLMVDGNLTTSYQTSTNQPGSISYTLSENLNVNRVNILQKSISHAKVTAYIEKNGVRKWVSLGLLNQSLNELVVDADYLLQIKISWDDGSLVNISELITYHDNQLVFANKDALQAAINKKPAKDESAYTSDSWQVYAAAFAHANEINDKQNATQEEVDQATTQLLHAFNNLIEKNEGKPIVPETPSTKPNQDKGNHPNTGDESNMNLFWGLLFGAGAITLLLNRKKYIHE